MAFAQHRDPVSTGDLDDRIAALTARLPRAGTDEIVRTLGDMRAIADAQGLRAAGTVAHLIALAASAGIGRAMVAQWLPVLRDAAASGRGDAQASASYAAACSVRLAG